MAQAPPDPDTTYVADRLVKEDIGAYLDAHQTLPMLRFITCGSVDDGKSTLIGRLLYDSKQVFEDQFNALAADSKKLGTQGAAIDFALLVDGLAAEREQGITIDVAYRFFATEKRKFIVADTPGHEQYTRNMVTGASTADLAVVLLDARKGVLTQTRRHGFLAHLLGIRHIVLAVNKMDLVAYDAARFAAIVADFDAFAQEIGMGNATAIPLSGLQGDNVATRSEAMPWYEGASLLAHLESVSLDAKNEDAHSFVMPVQWVNRPDSEFRGFSGQVAAGTVAPADAVRVLPSGVETRVGAIITQAGAQESAQAGESVTLTLADAVECGRGSVIADAKNPPAQADQFEATLIWMDEADMLPGRRYWLKLGTQMVEASIAKPKYEIDVNTQAQLAVKTLCLNAIGVVEITTDRRIIFAPYAQSRALGGFILIDKHTHRTVAAGLIHFALRRAENVHWQALAIDGAARAEIKNQTPYVVWFTGLSGSGKSTIADALERRLYAEARHTYMLDGDNIRHGLNRDLGFTEAARVENIRRIGEVARLMYDAGLIVLCAFISPFRTERQWLRELLPDGAFVEVYVDTPLAVAEARDVKGLYKKARDGELQNFTGIDSPYEAPHTPEIRINTVDMTADEAAQYIMEWLEKRHDGR